MFASSLRWLFFSCLLKSILCFALNLKGLTVWAADPFQVPNGLGQRKASAIDLMLRRKRWSNPLTPITSSLTLQVSLQPQLPLPPGLWLRCLPCSFWHSGNKNLSLGIATLLAGFLNLDHATVKNPFFKLVSVNYFLICHLIPYWNLDGSTTTSNFEEVLNRGAIQSVLITLLLVKEYTYACV